MPRNQGTSRKGKPGKTERAAGMGNALIRAQRAPKASRSNRDGMAMQAGITSIGITNDNEATEATKSVLELTSLDDFLMQADMLKREFETEHEKVVVLDNAAGYYGGSNNNNNNLPADFKFTELSVPRRPAWDSDTTPEQLQHNEQESFLEWRRAIAMREEQVASVQQQNSIATIGATPFEKNIEVWRQLWRVLERSSCLLQLVDARNPLFYLSQDLKDYATMLGKPMMVLLNKSDYLTAKQRQMWKDYLEQQGWECVFFSAKHEQAILDAQAQAEKRLEQDRPFGSDASSSSLNELNEDDGSSDDDDDDEIEEGNEGQDAEDSIADGDNDDERNDKSANASEDNQITVNDQITSTPLSQDGCGVDVPLSRMQLTKTLTAYARKHNCKPDERYDHRIQFGFVGFPNVGKSSVINVLMGSSKHAHGIARVAVAAQPGKTKHFQTLLLPDSDELMLCDCPGLVFPSFVSNTADLIAAGVYPIAQMRNHWPVISLICQRIPRDVLNAHYSITLPVPSMHEIRERGLNKLPPPTGEEFLTTLCIARSMLSASSGVPDFTRAARMVIKDYADGKLLYCHAPPSNSDDETAVFYKETFVTSMHNATKKREQQLYQDMQQKEVQRQHNINRGVYANEDDSMLEDDLMSEFLDNMDDNNAAAGGPTVRRNGRQQFKSKWGKKNRKFRDKDPYGCHSTPDELLEKHMATGVVVNAGKHSIKNYTRSTGYGSVHSVS